MRSTKGFRKLITIFTLAIAIFSSVVGVGYAQWNFSSDASYSLTANNKINEFIYSIVWENELCLDKSNHVNAETIQSALNDPSSNSAMNKILEHLVQEGYVSNVTIYLSCQAQFKNLGFGSSNSDKVVCINKTSDTQFEFYEANMTIKQLKNAKIGSTTTAYKTIYVKSGGKWYPCRSDTGTISIDYYSPKGLSYQHAIIPSTFVADKVA